MIINKNMIISKYEAKQQGLKTYFTGIPCKQGHISTRFMSGNRCTQCAKEDRDVWRKNNPEKVSKHNKTQRQKDPIMFKQTTAIYYQQNTEYIKSHVAKYRQDNLLVVRERENKNSKEYRLRNPEKMRYYCSNRRAIKLKAIPIWFERDLVNQIYSKCVELNKNWGLSLTVDHIIPINPKDKSVCGLHCWANLQLLDKSINSIKSDNYLKDW